MSKQVFVIRDQENRYYTKKRKWRSGADNSLLFRSPQRDVALNELIEANARDIMARLELLLVEIDSKGFPVVEVLTEDPPELDAEEAADDPEQASEDADDAGADDEDQDKPHLELVVSQESRHEQGHSPSPGDQG